MKIASIAALALAVLATTSAAQDVSFQFITPFGQFNQAIGISPNGEYVCGGGSSNGFIWSEAGGLVTGFGFPVQAWGVSNDGSTMAGEFAGGGNNQAGIWTSTGGATLLGNAGGAAGCGSDLSHLFGLAADGSTAVGMSWQGCRTSPMRWTPANGLTLMAKQNGESSARASRVSADGQVAGGWDQGLSTGQGFSRRASLWTDDNTQVFPATTPSNPNGYGEVLDLNSDGSVISGTTQSSAFRWVDGDLEVLPTVSGLGGQYYANGISEDGSIVAGVRLQFPTAQAIIWTPDTGAIPLLEFLFANGVTGVTAGDVRNATDVSADGKTICGWGNNGSWIVRLGDDTWTDLGGGSVGINGQPTLVVNGDLTAGSDLDIDLTQAPANALMLFRISLTSTPVNVVGGTLYTIPFDAQLILATDALGAFSVTAPVAAGSPPGTDIWMQFIVQDASSVFGLTLSNAVMATTP
jgi:hypothetical protein